MVDVNIQLMGHLMRRSGFGAGREELEKLVKAGYEQTVENLLEANDEEFMPNDMIRRYHHEQSGLMGQYGPGTNWLYRLIYTTTPLKEKITLFWHGVFATGYPKIAQGKVVSDQIRMFRRHSMGKFDDLLVELSKDPAMIVWLDNQDNHGDSINENYGRELLELFSMGVGNYTEDDVKDCARAFTGWTVANTEYMELRARRDSIWPYGRISWHYEYRPEDHDHGEKSFLGQHGEFGGEDIIDIICRQPSTARFIARHMYHFFVADEPPVPQWPFEPPRDQKAIDLLVESYFDSGYDIRSMLRVLFNSDFFKSQDVWFKKVKSPAELVAGTLRLSGELDTPKRCVLDRFHQMIYMGQQLVSPPSVEGWNEGIGWIDTGNLVERINFTTEQLGESDNPGVSAMIDTLVDIGGTSMSTDDLIDACLYEIGSIPVSSQTRTALKEFASKNDTAHDVDSDRGDLVRNKMSNMLRLTASTHEYQHA